MIIRMIFRELRSSPRFLIFFVFNLAIGLMGLTSIELFKSSFTRELETKSKSILGSDLSVSSRRPISDEKLSQVKSVLPPNTQAIKTLSMFSMARAKDGDLQRTKLVNVRIIDHRFPFYGKITIDGDHRLPQLTGNKVFVYPELKYQLGVSKGSTLSIGDASFEIAGFIADDGQQSMMFGSLAPRIYMSKSGLEQANLVKQGSTSWREFHYKFDSEDYSKTREEVIKALADPSIQVNTAKTSSRQVGRILGYLNDFLGLVSLAGLFLAGMGMIYLFRSFLHQRKKEIAILKFLGIKRSKVFQIYFGELFILGLAGSILGVALGNAILPFLKDAINTALETNIHLSFDFRSIFVTLTIGIASTMIMAPSLISPYVRVDHKILFSHEDDIKRTWKEYFLFVPMILFYWAMAIYLSKSYFVGTLFISIFVTFIAVSFPLGGKFLKLLSNTGDNLSLSSKLALKYVTRKRVSTLFIFSCLAISTFLITLIPQIRTTLDNEVQAPNKKNGPTYFLFDIQPEQVDQIQSFVNSSDLKLLNLSPMVRARLIKVKDKILQTDITEGLTREQERSIRMRNRGINLSYRGELDKSEMLIEGKLPKNSFDFENDEFAEVTLERRYAKRLNVWIGDTLEFDVLGLPVPVKIVGIRDVKWTSFMPNFFISFGQGVLEEAPKTYLAAISNPNKAKLEKFQNDFSLKFANISMIDVRRLVDKISKIIDSMGGILLAMATLVLIVGMLVIYSLISHQIYMRTKDLSLFKMLGLKTSEIRKSLMLEMSYVSLAAVLVGATLSTLISFIVSKQLFAVAFNGNLIQTACISVLIFLFTLVLSYIGSKRVLKRKPSEVFAEVD